jgi:hypothetical protein
MPEKLTFLGLAERVLREEKRPLSTGQIWKAAQAKGYDSQLGSKGKTPWTALHARISVSARDDPDTIFYKIGGRPARYFLKELKDTVKPDTLERPGQPPVRSAAGLLDFDEADLHPFMAYYAHTHFGAYTKTIRHTASAKSEFGEWVHPDMIGFYYPEGWRPEVLHFNKATGSTALKMYSFELKKELKRANLREAFFQAVSIPPGQTRATWSLPKSRTTRTFAPSWGDCQIRSASA